MKKILRSLLTLLVLLSSPLAGVQGQTWLMYVGTYTTWKDGGKGIYIYRFDPATATITYQGVRKGITNPSFLIVGPEDRYLYTVNEEGHGHGAVSSFAIDRATGELTLLSGRLTGGENPCHLTLDKAGKVLLTANYTGGSISLFPVRHGEIGERAALVAHEGHGPDVSRQRGPHPHQVVFDPLRDLLYVPDLGVDKVFIYGWRGAQQPVPADPPFLAAPAGGGPRHLAFSPDGLHMYLLLEMGSALVHFVRSDAGSPWQQRETVSLLPPGADPAGNTGAEVVVTPDGRFLYASNRGHNSIALFTLGRDGRPVMKETYPCGGKTPRFFTLGPTGRYLLVLNQDSNNMALFLRKKDGSLVHTGTDIFIPRPVCAVFVPAL